MWPSPGLPNLGVIPSPVYPKDFCHVSKFSWKTLGMRSLFRISAKREVKILSYNTHLFDKTYPGIQQCFLEKERRKEIAKIILEKSPDIACFCETWDVSTKEKIMQDIGHEYPYSVYFTHNLAVSDAVNLLKFQLGDGLLITSKYPLYNQVICEYNHLEGWDKMSHKSAMGVCVKYNENEVEKNFRLFLTHTQAGESSGEIKKRHENLQQMKHVTEVYHPGSPIVICGDLNVNGLLTEEVDTIMEVFEGYVDIGAKDNEFTVVGEDSTMAKRFGGKEDRQKRIDYFLTNNGITGTMEVQKDWKITIPEVCDTSDHFPIWGEFDVEPNEIRINEFNSYDSSTNSVLSAKKKYSHSSQFGWTCNLLRISNNTNDHRLELLGSLRESYDGKFQYVYPSPLISPGHFGSAFHRQPNGNAEGSCGGMVYRVYDAQNQPVEDIFLGFYSRWCLFSELNNRIYVESGECGNYFKDGVMKGLESKIKHSKHTHDCEFADGKLKVRAVIENKTSNPFTDFFVVDL